MANVLFSRTDSPSTKPITDGQIIFDTSGNGKMYLDNGTTRLEMGGAINVDATLDANSTNPIQNKGVAGVMLSELEEVRGVTKKGFLTDALATKTLDAKIGTTDISSIGDGTVTGAISDVNGKLQIKNIYSGKATVSSADWISVTVEFGGTVTDTSKIVPMVVGFQIYDGNHVPNIMINEITKTSFIASCYGLSAFQWVVLELY